MDTARNRARSRKGMKITFFQSIKKNYAPNLNFTSCLKTLVHKFAKLLRMESNPKFRPLI